MIRERTIRAALLALAAASAMTSGAWAAANSAKRVQAFTRLPDWGGYWIVDSIHETAGSLLDVPKVKFFGDIPYNPKWMAEYNKRRGELRDKDVKACVIDFPTTMESPQPFMLTVTPEQTLYMAGDGTFRQIFTDGRKHPPKDELFPTVNGHSIGHWQGQTLVVDTIGRAAGPVRFLGAAAFSDQAHFSERIRMTGKDRLEDVMMIDDPVALAHPWTVTLGYDRTTLIDRLDPYYCELDDRIGFDSNGKMVIKPPSDVGKP
jgi:hypothetical protein